MLCVNFLRMSSLLTFTEAAEYAGVHVKTIQKHVKHGRLEFTQTPMGKRVPRHCLEPYRQLRESNGVEESRSESAPWSNRDTEGVEKIQTGSEREPAGVLRESHREPERAAGIQMESTDGVQGSHRESVPGSGMESKVADEALHGTRGSREDANGVVPLVAHLAALNTAQKALERAEKVEQLWETQLKLSEEYRARAELAERQRLALELQLGQYRAALGEQAESLAEARAEKQAVQLQLEAQRQPELPALRIDTRKPSFGQRVKGWLGLKKFGS